MHVPVICDNCGAVFGEGGVRLPGAGSGVIQNFAMGPCPVCGGTGHAVDGIYDAVGDSLRILAAGESANLGRLRDLLQSWSVSPPASGPEAADALEDAAPDLSGFAQWLREAKSPAALAAWITVLLALITLVIELSQDNTPVEQVNIQETTVKLIQQAPPPESPGR